MSRRSLCYLKLWTVDSKFDDSLWPKLEAYLIASARYVKNFKNESLILPHRMSVRKAIDVLSNNLGMSAIDVSTPLTGLPVIARSRQSQNLVLLLPKGPDYFLVYDFAEPKIALIKVGLINTQFSECVQLFRSDFNKIINPELRKYFPKYIIKIASFFENFYAYSICSISSQITRRNFSSNRLVLFIFSLLALIISFFVHNFIIKISQQNLPLAFFWARWQLYFSVLALDLERYNLTSWAQVERVLSGLSIGVKKYFLDTPEIIITYVIIMCNLFFTFWFSKQFLIIYILVLIFIYIIINIIHNYTTGFTMKLCFMKNHLIRL